MSYAITELLEQLRAERLAQNLSQRELGERIGLPQSNVARLESGGTDPSLSKILELARALDLDLKLVPRKALPAVQGALRANQLGIDSNVSTSRAIHAIRQMKDAFTNLDLAQLELPDTLSKTLDDLERLRFDQTQLRVLQDAFKPMERTLDRVRKAGSPPKELSRRFRETNTRLCELRNRIAHGVELDQSHLKPAFSLEDYDDD